MLSKESKLDAIVLITAVLVFGLMAIFSSRRIQADVSVEGQTIKVSENLHEKDLLP
jgi:hypothetical protein